MYVMFLDEYGLDFVMIVTESVLYSLVVIHCFCCSIQNGSFRVLHQDYATSQGRVLKTVERNSASHVAVFETAADDFLLGACNWNYFADQIVICRAF